MLLLTSITHSYRSLPLWVQIWVLILVAVNLACLGFLDHVVGQAVALAGLLVILGNAPIMLYYRGMNRAMAIPHLFAWIPLSVFLLLQLGGETALAAGVRNYALSVLLINGISLLFDVWDSVRWLRGERETPGVPPA